MKQFKAEFIKGAVKAEQFPAPKYPEIAFAGRSNVGKSSLINSIVMNKSLAKTSSTPGKTREINFFIVENIWSFADLPGFGYASIGKEFRESWAKLNLAYLQQRDNLRLICYLIDSRHEPMKFDLAMLEQLESFGRNYIIILTKCDKISKALVAQRKEEFDYIVQNCKGCLEVLPYSSIDGTGRNGLIAVIKKAGSGI